MKKETKRKAITFFVGILIVSFLTVVGSLAFFSADLAVVLRNIVITDIIFVILYTVWVKLHKGYETMYKSGLELEEEK
ncbi:hypothetical protein HYU20_02910 [Candidatus Woesearchaeota archaeon]|nr:hypothetical protein [Candidatus Woesearchaeota archaeon]